MDFLDSIEKEMTRKMSVRMRSWYLFEQFKELERNQLVAAKNLRSKADQMRFLRQELKERRERRRMCSVTSSDVQHIQSERSLAAISDESFDNFCQLDDELIRSEEYNGMNCSSNSKTNLELQENLESEQEQELVMDSPSINEARGDGAYPKFNKQATNLVNSSLDQGIRLCINVLNNGDNDIEEKLEIVKNVIKDNMHLQLDTIRENMKCFEQFARMREDPLQDYQVVPELSLDGVPTDQRYNATEEYDAESVCSKDAPGNGYNTDDYSLWSKLVSFAYQLVQLNRGNFYYDYGAQFLTAVLACDVLRRGLNRMCDVLQHFTCPVKYPTEQDSESRRTIVSTYYLEQSPGYDTGNTSAQNLMNTKFPSKEGSKTDFNHIQRSNSTDSGIFESKLESWYFTSKRTSDVHSNIWPEEFNSVGSAYNSCRTHHSNPMLKLADIIDETLKSRTNCDSNVL